MVLEGDNVHHVNVSEGETEIERVPMHTIEVRSKDLIPVFDHLQATRSQKKRSADVICITCLPYLIDIVMHLLLMFYELFIHYFIFFTF